ncbi:MAG: P-loop NTPase [Firmicutes bacterium]|nr:P-loop NTPase [Bacillota bacterium]
MVDCDHDCKSCGVEGCEEDEAKNFNIFRAYLNKESSVKKVIGVVSGKGGVGKSLVTSLLAVEASKRGKKTAILDADITGPSIPKAFGVTGRVVSQGDYLMPCKSEGGIDIMSLNLALDNESDPVIWRGPMIASVVKQFWTDTIWDKEDVMFVDMPPGTGDVTLTVFQSLPLAGLVVVTSPQDLVGMIVEKAMKMASMMDIPVLGIVENMSYIKCPTCGEILRPFGESKVEGLARKYNIKCTAQMPIDQKLAETVDKGGIEGIAENPLADFAANLL